jgi:hypothetical protein
MRLMMNYVGMLLIVLGVLVFVYQGVPGFTYTKQENIAQLGDLKVIASEKHKLHIPPMLGGLCIVAGVVIILGAMRK